LPCKRSRYMSC